MKKDELWKIFTDKNPKWLESGANLTPAGLKKLFDTTYQQAHDQGVRNGRVLAEKESDLRSNIGDLFSNLGRGR